MDFSYKSIIMKDFNLLDLKNDKNAMFLFHKYLNYVDRDLSYEPRLEQYFLMGLKNLIILNYNEEGELDPDLGFDVLYTSNRLHAKSTKIEVNGEICSNEFVHSLFEEITRHVEVWRKEKNLLNYLRHRGIGLSKYEQEICRRIGIKDLEDLYFYSFAFDYTYNHEYKCINHYYDGTPYWFNYKLLSKINSEIYEFKHRKVDTRKDEDEVRLIIPSGPKFAFEEPKDVKPPKPLERKIEEVVKPSTRSDKQC